MIKKYKIYKFNKKLLKTNIEIGRFLMSDEFINCQPMKSKCDIIFNEEWIGEWPLMSKNIQYMNTNNYEKKIKKLFEKSGDAKYADQSWIELLEKTLIACNSKFKNAIEFYYKEKELWS